MKTALKLVHARIHPKELASVEAIANERKLTKSKIARLLIQEGLKALEMQKPA